MRGPCVRATIALSGQALEGSTLQDDSSHPAGGTRPRERGKGLVTVAFLGTPLYEQPDEAAPRLAYLNKGTVLEAIEEQGGFLHVRTDDGAEGYIRRRSVAPGAA